MTTPDGGGAPDAAPSGYAVVTGASGFVGGVLVDLLARTGWSVTALAHRRPVAPARAGVRVVPAPDAPGAGGLVPALAGALRGALPAPADPPAGAAARAERPPRVCFHLATHFRAVHEPSDIAPMIEANVAFGTALAQALVPQAPDCFLNVGTVWQHFAGAAYSPVSLYAATKQAFADVLAYYREVEGLRVATVELADTYGPGDPRPKLVPLLLRAATTGEAVELSTGDQLVDLVHVADAARALVAGARAAALADETPTRPWSAASGAPLTIREVVALVEQVTGRRLDARWGVRPRRPREMLTPWSTGERPPGWEPEIALADGLAELRAT